MKGFIAVAVAALACGASAGSHHRHAHEHLFKKGANDTAAVCVPGCKTIYKTVTGEATRTYHRGRGGVAVVENKSSARGPLHKPRQTQS